MSTGIQTEKGIITPTGRIKVRLSRSFLLAWWLDHKRGDSSSREVRGGQGKSRPPCTPRIPVCVLRVPSRVWSPGITAAEIQSIPQPPHCQTEGFRHKPSWLGQLFMYPSSGRVLWSGPNSLGIRRVSEGAAPDAQDWKRSSHTSGKLQGGPHFSSTPSPVHPGCSPAASSRP